MVEGLNITPEEWTFGLIIKLMEITHGQWLYHCNQVHDSISGTNMTAHKEALQQEIEAELEMGMEGLLDKDQNLCEFNLEDLENTLGEKQEYWLIAIRAVRKATTLQGNQHNSARCRAYPRRGEGWTNTLTIPGRADKLSIAYVPGDCLGRRATLSSGPDCDAVRQ